jgi:elongation factor P
MYEVATGQKRDESFKGNDYLEEMVLDRRPVSFIYREQSLFTFMDTENYEQYTIAEDSLDDQVQWLSEGLEGITALLLDGNILGIEIPLTMEFEITETAPAMRGASATNRTKPAILSNGFTVMVPEYVPAGETIKINTETGKFMSRVKN